MNFPEGTYRCIVADPPWPQPMMGRRARDPHIARELPYWAMSLFEIKAMPVARIARPGAHIWLWTTNSFFRQAFDVMAAWGFSYLTTITWVKPSGVGSWFVGTTQHCLFGYFRHCTFPLGRYKPTHFRATPKHHSAKPEEFYDLVRSISPEPRIDLFNRRVIEGFEGWGDETPGAKPAPRRGQGDLFS